MNFKALLKSNNKLIFKFCLLIGCFLIMTLFIFNNESFYKILKVHARKKPLAEDVSLSDIAKATAGFTGADLENLLNEAALLAARGGQRFISMADLHEAMMKVIAGPEKKSRVVTPHAKRLTAYHEAGHAVVIHELETQDPVHQITIIPRGGAGGTPSGG